jgi:hypothetical protein
MKMQDVAKYMLEELEKNGVLYQEGLVNTIKEKFGEQFIFANSYGTLSIDRVVIREFNKLKNKDVLWDKEEHCWR